MSTRFPTGIMGLLIATISAQNFTRPSGSARARSIATLLSASWTSSGVMPRPVKTSEMPLWIEYAFDWA